jgi:hypothetical protein
LDVAGNGREAGISVGRGGGAAASGVVMVLLGVMVVVVEVCITPGDRTWTPLFFAPVVELAVLATIEMRVVAGKESCNAWLKLSFLSMLGGCVGGAGAVCVVHCRKKV